MTEGTRGLLMRCERCGHEFEDRRGFVIRGQGIVSMSRNSVTCERPRCGGRAWQRVEGLFEIDETGRWNILRALRPPGVTQEDYERAVATIEAGREHGESAQQTVEKVAADVPIFAPVVALAKRYGTPAATILGLLLAIYSAVLATASYRNDVDARNDPPAAPSTVEVHIPDAELRKLGEVVGRQHPAVTVAPEPSPDRMREGPRSMPKVGTEPPRNSPCACGTGRKYKHCCGSPAVR